MSQVNELTAAVEEILIDEDSLQARIAELGREISVDYRGRDLLLVGVLKGAVFFMADLPKNAAGKILKRELRKHGELERGIDSRAPEKSGT